MLDAFIPPIQQILIIAVPLLFAALGELITEKSGILNLGVEGMMLVGAIGGFIIAVSTGNSYLGLFGGMLAAMTIAGLFAFITIVLQASQIAAGLATTIFGAGLSAMLGSGFVGISLSPIAPLAIPLLSDIPFIGAAFFRHDPLVYLSILATISVWFFLQRTRAGMVLRAVGENHDAAHALGYAVNRMRFFAVLVGGAFSGLAGCYLSLVYTPLWSENMTAGRGWIAIALVVFGVWSPFRIMLGAYLFGTILFMQLFAQAQGFDLIPPAFLSMLPYLCTIVVLIFISRNLKRLRLNSPQSLGRNFFADS